MQSQPAVQSDITVHGVPYCHVKLIVTVVVLLAALLSSGSLIYWANIFIYLRIHSELLTATNSLAS